MLVLGLAVGESVRIGPDVLVKILKRDSGGIVRVGLSAPKALKIMRTELETKEHAKTNDSGTPGHVPHHD